jgi:hypothetical protein
MQGDVSIALLSALPSWYCETHNFLKNVIVVAALIAVDSILVVKFVLIFWLKNASLCYADFWNCFVRLWITGFAFLSQFVHFFFPGKKTLSYYICIRDFPPSDHSLQYKVRWFTVFLTFLSIFLCLVIYIKIKLFIRQGTAANQIGVQNIDRYQSLKINMFTNKLSLLSVLTTMTVFLFLMMGWKSLDPFNMKIYPNYNIYWLLNTVPPFFIVFYLFVFIASKGTMTTVLLREAKEQFFKWCKS